MRTVIRTEEFESELLLIEPDMARADDLLEALEWLLARQPELGLQLEENVWSLDASEFVLAEPLTIYYSFDETRTWLVSIRKQQIVPEN